MKRLHGDRQRYLLGPDEHDQEGKGCRCPACKEANNAAARTARRRAAERRWKSAPTWADAEPVRRHIRTLMAQGPGWEHIAAIAGVAKSTVRAVLYSTGGRPVTERMRPELAERLLAVRLEQLLKPRTYIDATGTRRRVQALCAIGWTVSDQARRVGQAPTNMWQLTRAELVTVRIASHVAALYDELSMTPAPDSVTARQARGRAKAKGWAPPLAWDDDAIDDPAATPEFGGRAPRDVALFENSEELLRQGHTLEQAAERLGIKRNYLDTARKRARERIPA